MNKQTNIEQIRRNILQFKSKNHPAWDTSQKFSNRIRNLPFYYLKFNHHTKNKTTQSVTVTHYVPYRIEMIAISNIIRSFDENFSVCDIGCGNGFLGSLLAREGVSVFGIDDRSYKQPQIASFYDNECYKISETSLSDLKSSFDVAFCAWMTPGINLTPQIIKNEPLLIIHVCSHDTQTNGTLTTGIQETYECPTDYRFIVGWRTLFPQDYFAPLFETMRMHTLSKDNKRETNDVIVYAHKKLKSIDCIRPSDFTGTYDWDIERNFINQLRNDNGLEQYLMSILS